MQFLESFRRQFVLAHVSGIPVRADVRWLFVIALLSMVIAASIDQLVNDLFVSLLLGFVTTAVFFLSIFLHEFAHAFVARTEKLEVVEIVLHPFGGLTRFRHQPETPRAEFRIAIAGPGASFILAVIFALLAAAASSAGIGVLVVVGLTLAVGNFLIAVFNLFPGYPLDGGRVLRAYLWRSGKDLNEATILTGRYGQAIAVVTIFFGVFIAVFRQEFFIGFWAIVVGIFLFDSAKNIIREVSEMRVAAVEDVMMLPIAPSPDSSLHDFIEKILPMYRQAVFPVARDRQLYGMLLLTDIKHIEQRDWATTLVRDVMKPVEHEHFVETGTPLPEARELMRSNGIGAVGVLDTSGKLVGFLQTAETR
ncbi:MAG: site-2 protease family protein [Blastocatellia bacterium]|nr:site-2 protease family protein [Blastocatellia bacterium]